MWKCIRPYDFPKSRRFDAACGKLSDQSALGGEKITLPKVARQDPRDSFERNGLDDIAFDRRREEANFEFFVAVGVSVLHVAEFDAFGQAGAGLFPKFASECGFGGFALTTA